jgi:hypothetical protein
VGTSLHAKAHEQKRILTEIAGVKRRLKSLFFVSSDNHLLSFRATCPACAMVIEAPNLINSAIKIRRKLYPQIQ